MPGCYVSVNAPQLLTESHPWNMLLPPTAAVQGANRTVFIGVLRRGEKYKMAVFLKK